MSLINFFEKIVSLYPKRIAISDSDGNVVTYEELNIYSNQIANYLLQEGLHPNQKIGICLVRSIEMIASLLAVLKAGGIYIPLAVDYPSVRLTHIVKTAGLDHVVLNHAVINKFPIEVNFFDIDINKDKIKTMPKELKVNPVLSELAYIIFTSGTTGQPKGVLVKQNAVSNLVLNQNYISISPDDTFLQLSPFEFDGATFEIWAPLLHGAKLVLMPLGYPTLNSLETIIHKDKVSILFMTTQFFNLMVEQRLEALDTVPQILFGGESASFSHVRHFIKKRRKNKYLANIYGPTECTVFSTFYSITSEDLMKDKLPIGKPIKNVYAIRASEEEVKLCDCQLGELLIGGAGIANGYLDDQKINASQFCKNPFDVLVSNTLYKTGDIVEQDEDGNFIFLGRFDQELKIRGNRILPYEIESIVTNHPAVQAAAFVCFRRTQNEYYLVLFIVLSNDVHVMDIKQYLKVQFPRFLQINKINIVNELPLKKNGKIDYEALQNIVRENLQVKGICHL